MRLKKKSDKNGKKIDHMTAAIKNLNDKNPDWLL